MSEQEALERTYQDSCKVYRRTNQKDPVTKQNRQTEILIAEAIPCALSQTRGSGISFEGGYGGVSSSRMLFCSPGHPISAGDKVVVTTAAGQSFTTWAGKPFTYPNSHSEILLQEKEKAQKTGMITDDH